MIIANAKYNPPQPQIASMNVHLPTNDANVPDETDLHEPIVSAARTTMGTTETASDKTYYKPTRCKACGLTQKTPPSDESNL